MFTMSVTKAHNDEGKEIAGLYQAVIYHTDRFGRHTIHRLSDKRQSYSAAWVEAYQMHLKANGASKEAVEHAMRAVA